MLKPEGVVGVGSPPQVYHNPALEGRDYQLEWLRCRRGGDASAGEWESVVGVKDHVRAAPPWPPDVGNMGRHAYLRTAIWIWPIE